MHWDGDYLGKGQPVARGYKLYFHRQSAASPNLTDPRMLQKEKVITRLQPGKKGCKFRSVIQFDNLREFELGAMLSALILPAGCAHKLGMAKPLGLGSFAIEAGSADHR